MFLSVSIMRLLMVQRMAWDSRHAWQTLDLTCLCEFLATVRRQEFSRTGTTATRTNRYLWLQERVAASHLAVQKVKTTQNPADILTKAASREALKRHRKVIGLRHVEARRSSDLRVQRPIPNQLIFRGLQCQERVQAISSDPGTTEVVGSTGMRRIVMRTSLPLTSRS